MLSVCLTDTNSSEDIHINDLLVHDGYAIFCPDTDESLHAADSNLPEVSLNFIDQGGFSGQFFLIFEYFFFALLLYLT